MKSDDGTAAGKTELILDANAEADEPTADEEEARRLQEAKGEGAPPMPKNVIQLFDTNGTARMKMNTPAPSRRSTRRARRT